jgi:hypothetical protein
MLLPSNVYERVHFFNSLDSLNANASGGIPLKTQRLLGHLKLGSGRLVLGDPQYMPSVEVPNILADEATISANLWQYPSGFSVVLALRIELGGNVAHDSSRRIGELAIDSARVIVADGADFEKYWTEVGKDRIGVVSTALDDTMLNNLKRRFNLQTVQRNPIRAEVVGAISESLERDIEEYVRSFPEYAEFPYFCFCVQTNNSFDRANRIDGPWSFIPMGDENGPLMFVCSTGRGDAVYDVYCDFAGETPCVLSIVFMDDDATR